MANREAQNYLSSGEITEIKIGGTADTNKVQTKEDIAVVPTEKAYCSYISSTEVTLTSSFITVDTFTQALVPQGVSYLNGQFTALVSGVWEFNLERIYVNEDNIPTAPVRLYLEMVKNGSIIVLQRDAIISAATAIDEPAICSFNTNRIISVEAGDTFFFRVRAQQTDNAEPLSTKLEIMEVMAHKVFN